MRRNHKKQDGKNGQMKIAMFGHKRIPSREGGIEIVVEELCVRMARAGHAVTCYNRAGHHVSGARFDRARIKQYQGVKIKTVPAVKKKGLSAVSASFFASLAAALGPYDVVHIHAEGPAFFCRIPKLFRKKVVVTVHRACEIIGITGKSLKYQWFWWLD